MARVRIPVGALRCRPDAVGAAFATVMSRPGVPQPMSDDEPTVPVHCPACETSTRVPLSRVGESVDAHNDQLHDGRAVAHVDPAVRDQLADLVAEDLGLID